MLSGTWILRDSFPSKPWYTFFVDRKRSEAATGRCSVTGDVHTQFVTQNVKWHFQLNPVTHPWKRQLWPNILLKISYINTIRKKATTKDLLWYLYSTKIDNITIKITKPFTSFHTWHSKLLHWSVGRSLRILIQEVLMGMRNLWGNFEIIWKLDKILVRVMRYNICCKICNIKLG